MLKHKLLVLSNPVDGRSVEYNNWYDDVHLKEVLELDGMTSAERFTLADNGKWKYLAIYELDTDDPQHILDTLYRLAAEGEIDVTDALDSQSTFPMIATSMGVSHTAERLGRAAL